MRKATTTLVGIIFVFFTFTGHASLIGMSTDTDSIYKIDPETGKATIISSVNGNYAGIGLSYLSGNLYATDHLVHIGEPWDVRLSQLEPISGSVSNINQQDGSLNWHGLASNEMQNILYAIDINDNFALKATSLDGQITQIGFSAGIDGRGMAYDDKHKILYATNSSGGLYSVNTSTGGSTFIGELGLGNNTLNFVGLAYDELRHILFANIVPVDFPQSTREGVLYTVDVLTGAATLIGSNGVNFIDGLAWVDDTKYVTEPPTLALFWLGLASLALARRK